MYIHIYKIILASYSVRLNNFKSQKSTYCTYLYTEHMYITIKHNYLIEILQWLVTACTFAKMSKQVKPPIMFMHSDIVILASSNYNISALDNTINQVNNGKHNACLLDIVIMWITNKISHFKRISIYHTNILIQSSTLMTTNYGLYLSYVKNNQLNIQLCSCKWNISLYTILNCNSCFIKLIA